MTGTEKVCGFRDQLFTQRERSKAEEADFPLFPCYFYIKQSYPFSSNWPYWKYILTFSSKFFFFRKKKKDSGIFAYDSQLCTDLNT